jgi:hypothetical protein
MIKKKREKKMVVPAIINGFCKGIFVTKTARISPSSYFGE